MGVGTSIHCRILGFRETCETKKRLLLVGCMHLLPTHFLLLIGWSQKLVDVWALHDSSVFKVWYLEFLRGEGNTFNTTFGCENMACRPFSSEPLEMLLHPLIYSPRCGYATNMCVQFSPGEVHNNHCGYLSESLMKNIYIFGTSLESFWVNMYTVQRAFDWQTLFRRLDKWCTWGRLSAVRTTPWY